MYYHRLLPILFLCLNVSLLEGQAYRHDWDAAIRDLHRKAELSRAAHVNYVQSTTEELIEWRNGLGYYERITDGWHEVIFSNGYDFINKAIVYVRYNQIKKAVLENRLYETTVEIDRQAAVHKKDDGISLFFFIDAPSKLEYTPKFGEISFWSNFKGGGHKDIYLDDRYIGKLDSYFSTGIPNCGQSGTLTYTYKIGSYSYRAENSRWKWKGTITVMENQCNKKLIQK